MNEFSRHEQPGPPHQFAELSVVSLRHDGETEDGVMPAGTSGTVVGAYSDGYGYEVEFDSPFHAVVTLNGSDLMAWTGS